MGKSKPAIQEKILRYIHQYGQEKGYSPSIRDIMKYMGYRSPRAVSFHLDRMKSKGLVSHEGKARSLLIEGKVENMTVPIFGMIPAGRPERQAELPLGKLEIPPALFSGGIKKNTFALTVHGDSMEGANIFDGDIIIVEPRSPKEGDLVVALIDGENTLKRLVKSKGRYLLRAENPKYPALVPLEELAIQGVAIGIYRKF